jgi:hypothetical protein
VLEQMDDMTKINEEIARTAEAMTKIAKNLVGLQYLNKSLYP